MNMDEWLDEYLAEKDPRGVPDCYIVFKTDPRSRQITGPPLAVFKTEEALRKHFPTLCKKTDERWGISVACWWFDDEEKF